MKTSFRADRDKAEDQFCQCVDTAIARHRKRYGSPPRTPRLLSLLKGTDPYQVLGVVALVVMLAYALYNQHQVQQA